MRIGYYIDILGIGLCREEIGVLAPPPYGPSGASCSACFEDNSDCSFDLACDPSDPSHAFYILA